MVQKQSAGGQLPDEPLPSSVALPPAASAISCREMWTRRTAVLPNSAPKNRLLILPLKGPRGFSVPTITRGLAVGL